jgi:hypothetical protein
VVLPPERRQKAPVVFSTSGDRRRRQLALRGHARETGEAPASSGGLAEVTRWGSYRRGGRRRYPSLEGASFGGAAIAASGDEAEGRFGGLTDVLGFPPRRQPPQVGSGYGREAGCWRPYPAHDAPRPWVRFSGKCPILLLFCTESPLLLTVGVFVRPQGLRFYKPSLPLVPEDAVDRAARRTSAEKKRRRMTRKRPGPTSGCGLGQPWRSVVGGRRGTGSRGSRRRRRLTMMTMMMMTRATTWRAVLASTQI